MVFRHRFCQAYSSVSGIKVCNHAFDYHVMQPQVLAFQFSNYDGGIAGGI